MPTTETKTLNNGFQYLVIRNKSAEAKIALQGAHLFHFQKHGDEPLLWVSKKSHFTNGKAIRGGIPICWPWFGKHKTDANLPQHGFARTTLWEYVATKEKDDSSTEITLRLPNTPNNAVLWPYKAELTLRITIGSILQLDLITRNCGRQAFTISSALHSYFTVSTINDVTVKGLDNTPFLDTLTMKHDVQNGNIRIHQETDRVYQNVLHPITLHDRKRVISIRSMGSKSAVLWNPWIEKSQLMTDLNNNGYQKMLCIETANALEDEHTLAPGTTHTLSTSISTVLQ
jgi:glucose-6-phosphate 1-epimerase